jgi:Carboxypeptidase regulatory-like domain
MVVGRVVDKASGASVDGAAVSALDSTGTVHGPVLSDTSGRFALALPFAGSYMLHASRLGYDSIAGERVDVGENESVTVELQLAVEPVELDSMVVVGRVHGLRERDLHEYFERVPRFRAAQIGRIYTRADLAPMDLWTWGEFMRREAPILSGAARHCSPAVFWDGSPVQPDSLMPVSDIEGIEFYHGSGPAQIRFHNPDGCGVVLVWSRPVDVRGPSSSTKVLLVVLGLLAVVAAIIR